MYKLVTNDASAYALSKLPFEAKLEKKGIIKTVLCIVFGPEIDTLSKVKEICNDELKTSTLTFYENNTEIREEKDYTVLEQICTTTIQDESGKEVDVLMAKLSKSSTFPEQIASLVATIEELRQENTAIKQENNEIKQMLEVSDQIASLVATIDELKQENNTIKQENGEIKQMLEVLNTNIITNEALNQENTESEQGNDGIEQVENTTVTNEE